MNRRRIMRATSISLEYQLDLRYHSAHWSKCDQESVKTKLAVAVDGRNRTTIPDWKGKQVPISNRSSNELFE